MIVNWIAPWRGDDAGVLAHWRRVATLLGREIEVRDWRATASGWSGPPQGEGSADTTPPFPTWAALNRADLSIYVLDRDGGIEVARVADLARLHPGVLLLPEFSADDLLEWAARSAAPHRAHDFLLAAIRRLGSTAALRSRAYLDGAGPGGRRAAEPRAGAIATSIAVAVPDRETAEVARVLTDTPVYVLASLADGATVGAFERCTEELLRLSSSVARGRNRALGPVAKARAGSALGALGMYEVSLERIATGIAFLSAEPTR